VKGKPRWADRVLGHLRVRLGLEHRLDRAWAIKAFLWFLVLAIPADGLALQFYYSSKGALLSSAIAGCFGALLSLSLPQGLKDFLSLLSPFILVACIVLLMPLGLTCLYALTLATLLSSLLVLKERAEKQSGGRSELVAALRSLAQPAAQQPFRNLFILWSVITVATILLERMIALQSVALIPMSAIAIILSSVLDSEHQKEPK